MSAARGSTAATTTQEPPIAVRLLHRYGLRLLLSVVLTVGLFPGTVKAHEEPLTYVESSNQIIPPTLPTDCLMSLEVSCKVVQEKLALQPVPPTPASVQTAPSAVSTPTISQKPAPKPKLTVNSGRDYGTGMTIIAGPSPAYNNCYSWVASQRSIPHTRNGNAGTTPTDSRTPAVGAAAVMFNHIAIVVSYTDTTVTVKEANVKRGYLDVRTIPRSAIYGYVR